MPIFEEPVPGERGGSVASQEGRPRDLNISEYIFITPPPPNNDICNELRWACLQKSNRQLPLIICRPRKTNFRFPFLFAANKRSFVVSISIYLYLYSAVKQKTENQKPRLFLNPFTICSACKQRFVVFPFVDKETNRSYLFANGVNGLAHPLLIITNQ